MWHKSTAFTLRLVTLILLAQVKRNSNNKPCFHGSGAWITFQVPGSGYRPIRSRRSISSAMTSAGAGFLAMEVDASAAPVPGTPTQEPSSPEPATGLDGGASVGTTGQPSSSGQQQQPWQQGLRTDPMQQVALLMQNLIQMNIDREVREAAVEKRGKHWMASGKLEEKYFRSLKHFDHEASNWKEWRRHFLNSVKECDDSFVDLIESFEKSPIEVDDLTEYNPTQAQQNINLHVRLSNCTTGFAHNIVEGVKNNNGGEAWRKLNQQLDPKTDQGMMTLVLEIIEW